MVLFRLASVLVCSISSILIDIIILRRLWQNIFARSNLISKFLTEWGDRDSRRFVYISRCQNIRNDLVSSPDLSRRSLLISSRPSLNMNEYRNVVKAYFAAKNYSPLIFSRSFRLWLRHRLRRALISKHIFKMLRIFPDTIMTRYLEYVEATYVDIIYVGIDV